MLHFVVLKESEWVWVFRQNTRKKLLQLNPEQKSVLQTTLFSIWYLLRNEDDRQLEWMCGLCYIYTYFRPFGCQPTARWFILLNLPYFLMALGVDDWVYAVLWVHSSCGVTHTDWDVRHIFSMSVSIDVLICQIWHLFLFVLVWRQWHVISNESVLPEKGCFLPMHLSHELMISSLTQTNAKPEQHKPWARHAYACWYLNNDFGDI